MTSVIKVDNIQNSSGTSALSIDSSGNVSGVLEDNAAEFDQWYLTASHTTNATITNWARADGAGNATGWTKVGTGMSHSSGVFTFPRTGVYRVHINAQFRDNGDDNVAANIEVTTDNSTYTQVGQALSGNDSSQNSTATLFYFVNVTDTSNVKVRFSADSLASGSFLHGEGSGKIRSNVLFERIAPAQ